jgi:hypothetical protein
MSNVNMSVPTHNVSHSTLNRADSKLCNWPRVSGAATIARFLNVPPIPRLRANHVA